LGKGFTEKFRSRGGRRSRSLVGTARERGRGVREERREEEEERASAEPV
jgi:hypothetical protein